MWGSAALIWFIDNWSPSSQSRKESNTSWLVDPVGNANSWAAAGASGSESAWSGFSTGSAASARRLVLRSRRWLAPASQTTRNAPGNQDDAGCKIKGRCLSAYCEVATGASPSGGPLSRCDKWTPVCVDAAGFDRAATRIEGAGARDASKIAKLGRASIRVGGGPIKPTKDIGVKI